MWFVKLVKMGWIDFKSITKLPQTFLISCTEQFSSTVFVQSNDLHAFFFFFTSANQSISLFKVNQINLSLILSWFTVEKLP